MKIKIRSIMTGLVLILLLVGSVFLFKKFHKPSPAPQPPVAAGAYQALPKVLGPDTAPVKLVEFSDFECPSCRVAQGTLAELLKDFPGKIQITYKHFPLTSHRWSLYAHQAAECMHAQGKFWSYHDKLYEKQQEWSPSNVPPVEVLARYAQEQGGDANLFMACLADVAVTKAIYAEKEEGAQKQVNATPTFFLGEERFVGPKEMKERGVNAVRKILGLPEIPVPVAKDAPAPAPQTQETKKP